MSRPAISTPRLERDGAGDFVLDPDLLAERFSLSAQRFRHLVRSGQVKSSVEQGFDEDEGRRRLTVRCGNRAWTVVVDADGDVVSENLTMLRHAPAR